MKRLIVVIASLFVVPAMTPAQDTERPPRWQAYSFIGAGTHSMRPTGGLGGEAYLAKGIGLGAEVGAAGWSTTGNYGETNIIGVGSADVSYHVFPKKIRGNAAPFVTGGYTLFFGRNATDRGKDVTTTGFNVGGGVDVFATKHVGVRFDVRYFGHGGRILRLSHPEIEQLSFVAFRIGVTFR